MRESLRSGISFGITSGIVTTLGLIVGLNSGTHSALAVLGGIFALAVSDSLSESMGMHISKKSEAKDKAQAVESAFGLLASKFITTMTFAIPVLLVDLRTAVVIDVAWGLLLLAALTYSMPEHGTKNRAREIAEHLALAIVVIIAAYYAGGLINAI